MGNSSSSRRRHLDALNQSTAATSTPAEAQLLSQLGRDQPALSAVLSLLHSAAAATSDGDASALPEEAPFSLTPEEFVDPPAAESLACAICTEVRVAMVAPPCGHVCCARCLRSLRESTVDDHQHEGAAQVASRSCPTCRRRFTRSEVELHTETIARVQALVLAACPHAQEGCSATDLLLGDGGDRHSTLAHHLTAECEHHPRPCSQCGKSLNRHQRRDHECVGAAACFSAPSPLPVISSHSTYIDTLCLRAGGFNVLHQAAASCPPSFVRALLSSGADPNARTAAPLDGRDFDTSAAGGYFYRCMANPRDLSLRIMSAARYSDRLSRNVHSGVKYREVALSPLHLAIIFASDERVVEVAQLLLLYGGDVHATTQPSGCSALSFAACRLHPHLWATLLEHATKTTKTTTSDHRSHPRDSSSSAPPHAPDRPRSLAAEAAESALTVARQWGSRECQSMITGEHTRRTRIRATLIAQLGDQFRMAQVSVDICLAYAGLI